MENADLNNTTQEITILAKDIDEYLTMAPDQYRDVLTKLRKAIKSAAPKAEESISYQIPTFKYNGPLVFFAAYKDHCSFFVVSKSILEKFKNELKPYKSSGTTIHFNAENPIPTDLVKKIVKERIKENESRIGNVYNKRIK
jgi:uncharacterized protein YdhG (YjbR/CyaY superfamily)